MICLLLYSPLTDISEIKRILDEHDIEYLSPYDQSPFDAVSIQFFEHLKESDFTISVLDNLNPNLLFELGMAVGTKKPAFAIIPESIAADLPADILSKMTYTIADPRDYQKIKYSFDFFEQKLSYKERPKYRQLNKQMRESKNLLKSDFLPSIDFTKMTGQQFEDFLSALFKQLGIDVVARNQAKESEFAADFSLWLDDLDGTIGNPIIIEAKARASQLGSAIQQLSSYITKYKAKMGLVIYNDPSGSLSKPLYSLNPLIISISVQELLEKLSQKSLSEIILELRNDFVHRTNT